MHHQKWLNEICMTQITLDIHHDQRDHDVFCVYSHITHNSHMVNLETFSDPHDLSSSSTLTLTVVHSGCSHVHIHIPDISLFL